MLLVNSRRNARVALAVVAGIAFAVMAAGVAAASAANQAGTKHGAVQVVIPSSLAAELEDRDSQPWT
ncbi:hypothetical protein [Krasilnikovia sp. MM14-A1259]|uniref:hypothetical protein n=1 Tax=Krasilnikovia sp. MM14-A1259 TaxID=3373539 RepID=UPI003829A19D